VKPRFVFDVEAELFRHPQKWDTELTIQASTIEEKIT